MRTSFAKMLAFVLATSSGCVMGGSSIYQQDQTGGVLVLQGDEADAMKDANARMTAHCGPGAYAIVKRETVVVGSENYTNTQSGFQQDTERQQVGAEASQTQVTSDQQYTDASGTKLTEEERRRGTTVIEETHSEGQASQQTTVTDQNAYAHAQHEQQQGQAASQSVSGVREVREQRLTYQCTGPR